MDCFVSPISMVDKKRRLIIAVFLYRVKKNEKMLLLKVKLEPSNICANQAFKIYTCSAHYDNAERFKPITINLWLGFLDASDRIKPTHLHRCLFQNSTLDWNPSSIAVYRKCATYKRSVRSAHYSNAERWARSRNLNMRDFSFQHRETGDAWKRKKKGNETSLSMFIYNSGQKIWVGTL